MSLPGRRLAVLGANPAFRRMWIGQFTSDLGSSVVTVAMPLMVIAVTGSAEAAGLLGTVGFLTTWLAAMPAGQVADRVRPRRLMLACDAIRLALTVLVTVAVWLGTAPLWLLVPVMVVQGSAAMAFNPAAAKMLRAVVPAAGLPEAVAANQVRGYSASILGPVLGGLLFSLGRAVPFAANALSYAVSFAAVHGLPPGPVPGAAEGTGEAGTSGRRSWTGVWRGLSVLRNTPFLRATVGYGVVTNLAVSMLLFVLLLRPEAGGGGVGLSLSVAAAAGLTGSMLAPWALRRSGLYQLLLAVCLVRLLAVTAAALVGGPVALGVGLAVVLFAGPVAGAAIRTTTLLTVDQDVYGRVSGAASFVGGSLQPLAPLGAGLIVQQGGAGSALTVVAVLFLVGGTVVAFGSSALRGVGVAGPAPEQEGSGQQQGRVVGQDALGEAGQFGAGIGAQLVTEQPAGRAEDLQGLGRSAATVEGQGP